MVVVLFASEGGNACEASYEFSEKAINAGIKISHTGPIDSYCNLNILQNLSDPVIFLVSTAGMGECPFNMRKLWSELVRSDLSESALSNLKFAIFGLGDSKYPHFNYAARKFRTRLLQLGSSEFCRYGLGDDQHDFGFEGELDPWTDIVLTELIALPGVNLFSSKPLTNDLLPPECYIIEEMSASDSNIISHSGPSCPFGDSKGFSLAEIIRNVRTTSSSHNQNVRDIRISLKSSSSLSNSRCDITGENLPYLVGDVLSVFPVQDANNALKLLESQRLNPETMVKITLNEGMRGMNQRMPATNPFPSYPISLRTLFTEFIDISSYATRHLLRTMSHFTSLDIQVDALRNFAGNTPDDKNRFYEYVKAERRAAWEVLVDFSMAGETAVRVPLSRLVSCLPLIAPRRYSIASSPRRYDAERFLKFAAASLASRADVDEIDTLNAIRSDNLMLTRALQNGAIHHMSFKTIMKHAVRSLVSNGPSQPSLVPTITKVKDTTTQEKTNFDVHLCVAEVIHKTRLQRQIPGVCSTFLCSLQPGSKIQVRIEPGLSFRGLNGASQNNFIAVGPGTGCAPLMAIAEDRALLACSGDLDLKFNEHLGKIPGDFFFLGFRHPGKDFLMRLMWDMVKSVSDKSKMTVDVAFSRLNPEKVVYIQDLLEKHFKSYFSQLMLHEEEQASRLLVCGRSHPMPDQISRVLFSLFLGETDGNADAANVCFKFIRDSDRYIVDTWG